ncbi:MAG: alpha-glucan family phosphorylase [Bradyrhizobiaceae bacterium]|nr:alpha-glucan family phosphorylase [Bradyrhizobiaceae bacterium]
MKPVTTFVVAPTMPPALLPLKEIAYNYWWCWQEEAIDLFRRIDPILWEEVLHNPVAMLSRLSHDRLIALSQRQDFISLVGEVHQNFRTYMEDRGWYASTDARPASYVAYFCAEFGIHESFSSYSGGLGVLAGDHLKSASDLGLPLVGIGLLYQEGYFKQYLTQNGWQNEEYREIDFHDLPLTPVMKGDGKPLTVSVDLPIGTAYAQVWRVNVGRVPLYMLDTNIPQNTTDELRNITDRLYGGDTDARIRQEIVLGIGGMRALEALGIEPAAIHMNEGHAAYSALERTRMFMVQHGLSFAEAWRITQTSTVFTTHTPVPAGNEVFYFDQLKPYFEVYAKGLGITWEQFLALGSVGKPQADAGFSMTILGLRSSSYRNGVSKLHGEVAREMWKDVWADFNESEVPIGSITNGVHTQTWVAPEFADLYDKYLGRRWRTQPHLAETWEPVHTIPAIELWRAHQRRRDRLVIGAREHILSKHSTSLTQSQVSKIHNCLDPDVLTIGFARRFATYKRADLLMRDMDRLTQIVTSSETPVQIIMAGKAHPKDTAGKELIQSVHQKIAANHLDHRIVFLEDYNMDVARLMVRGSDIWLNTPRKPYEASGTSGMKAAANGVLHFSILDGWWAEAYDGENGFAIGRGESFDADEQDAADASTLYDILEHAIVPLFYTVGNGGRVPERWIAMMKHSISSLAWRFSAQRMVREYTTEFYKPAMDAYRTMTSNGASEARTSAAFLNLAATTWSKVAVQNVNIQGTSGANVGKNIHVSADVVTGSLTPLDLLVQIVHGKVDSHDSIVNASFAQMRCTGTTDGIAHYEGEFICEHSGVLGCTVRALPTHQTLANVPDAFLVKYAGSVT